MAVFLGDLVDRGPRVLDTLRIVYAMVDAGSALCVMGNHEQKLVRALAGRQVQVSHGLADTLAEFEAVAPADSAAPADPADRDALRADARAWLDGLVSHYVLDDGRLVVAHAGLKAEMHGRGSGAVREFALYGDTTGETDEYGLPVRLNWARTGHWRRRSSPACAPPWTAPARGRRSRPTGCCSTLSSCRGRRRRRT